MGLCDLGDEALISMALNRCEEVLLQAQKVRYLMLLVCCCCRRWNSKPLGLKESRDFGIVKCKFQGVEEKCINIFICLCLACSLVYKGGMGNDISQSCMNVNRDIVEET